MIPIVYAPVCIQCDKAMGPWPGGGWRCRGCGYYLRGNR